jgi:hypothetical protein
MNGPQAVSLDEERKQRQQLLLGGEICTIHSFMDKEIAIAFFLFYCIQFVAKGGQIIDTLVLIFTLNELNPHSFTFQDFR